MTEKAEFCMVYMLDKHCRRGEISPRNNRRFNEHFARLREAEFDAVDLEGATGGVGADTYFDRDFMLNVMDLCHQNGLKVYLNVGTGGPQAKKYPGSLEPGYGYEEACRRGWLATDIYGQRTDSPNLYNEEWRREFLRPYLETIVEYYAAHPAFAGYRTGDTYMGNGSWSEADRLRFQQWLQKKYGDPQLLSDAWGEKLKSWAEVTLPRYIAPWSPKWEDWIEAQNEWLIEFAKDFVSIIKNKDPDPKNHKIWVFAPHWLFHGEGEMYRGFSPEFFAPYDGLAVFGNFPVERWRLERALPHLERAITMLRKLAPEKELGLMDIPGPRLGLVPDQMYPAERLIAISRRAWECGCTFLHYDGYIKSLKQTAVAYIQTFVFHQDLLDELASFHRELKRSEK